jgi:hypothetical protein
MKLKPIVFVFLCLCFGCGLKSGVNEAMSIEESYEAYAKLSSNNGKRYLISIDPLEYRLKEISKSEASDSKGNAKTLEVKVYDSKPAKAIFHPDIFYTQLLAGMSATTRFIPFDKTIAGGLPTARNGEYGPLKVTVSLTELTVASDVKTTDTGHAGTVVRSVAQSAVGFIPGAAIFTGLVAPTLWNIPLDYADAEITSAVALDIALLDLKTHKVIVSFPVRATSTKKYKEFGSIVSLHSQSTAENPLEEATRLALLDGVHTMLDKLDEATR